MLAVAAVPEHLNPAITTQGGVHAASRFLYNGLVELGPNLELIPELATSWDIEDDGRLYRFHLRDGVRWHDGTPFTAADVRFTFDSLLLRFHARTRASLGTVVQEIRTPDSATVEFLLSEPYAPLLRQVNVLEAPILPRHLYAGRDPLTNPANTTPVGTGPFRFTASIPGAELRYSANAQYFRPDRPRVDRLILRVLPDQGSQVIALEAGEVDWLLSVPGPDQSRLRAHEDVRLLQTPRSAGGDNCIMTMSFNLDRVVFGDVRVRRAIAHALDRQQFLDRVLFGQGRVATAPISSGIPFAHHGDLQLPAYDPAAAARLLTAAGWHETSSGIRQARGVAGVTDGTPLEISFLHFPTFTAYGELLRAQLAAVGIAVELRALEPPTFVQAVFGDRAFDTNVISYCNSTDPEVGVRRLYISSNIAPVPFTNSSAYRNAVVDSLFDAARRTFDQEARGRLYRRIQEILADELPYVWLVETENTWAHRARCRGFTPYGHFADDVTCRP